MANLPSFLSSLQGPHEAVGAFLGETAGLPAYKTVSDEEAGAAAKPNELRGRAAIAKSYNSRRGQIVGLLSEMRDQFSRDLGAAQKADLEAEIGFQHVRAAKLGEIAAGEEQKKQKEEDLATLKNG